MGLKVIKGLPNVASIKVKKFLVGTVGKGREGRARRGGREDSQKRREERPMIIASPRWKQGHWKRPSSVKNCGGACCGVGQEGKTKGGCRGEARSPHGPFL